MSKVLVEVDTTSPASLRGGLELLRALLEPLDEMERVEEDMGAGNGQGAPAADGDDNGPVGASPDRRPPLDPIIQALTDSDKYDRGRRGYMAMVAEAGDCGAECRAIIEHFGQRGSLAFGGTHSAIERAWRALKGTEWGPRLIWDSPDKKRQTMLPEARALVLEHTSGWDEL